MNILLLVSWLVFLLLCFNERDRDQFDFFYPFIHIVVFFFLMLYNFSAPPLPVVWSMILAKPFIALLLSQRFTTELHGWWLLFVYDFYFYFASLCGPELQRSWFFFSCLILYYSFLFFFICISFKHFNDYCNFHQMIYEEEFPLYCVVCLLIFSEKKKEETFINSYTSIKDICYNYPTKCIGLEFYYYFFQML